MARTAWIAGASGLVGGALLERLLAAPEYSRVVCFVRRPLELSHPKLDQRQVDFADLQTSGFPAPDDAFCTLGTTIKKAGSKEAFRQVDYGYSLAFAQAAADSGARRFGLVTSVATDARSPNFYLRVKADLESSVAALPFSAVDYFRPSFLLGQRPESRPAERVGIALAKAFTFLLFGPMRIYRPISADAVAQAMLAAALTAQPGRRIRHYDEMIALPSQG